MSSVTKMSENVVEAEYDVLKRSEIISTNEKRVKSAPEEYGILTRNENFSEKKMRTTSAGAQYDSSKRNVDVSTKGIKSDELEYDILRRNKRLPKGDSGTAAEDPEEVYGALQTIEEKTSGGDVSSIYDLVRLENMPIKKISNRKGIIMSMSLISAFIIILLLLTAALVTTGMFLVQKQKTINSNNAVISKQIYTISQLKIEVGKLNQSQNLRMVDENCTFYNKKMFTLPSKTTVTRTILRDSSTTAFVTPTTSPFTTPGKITPTAQVTSCNELPRLSPSGYYWITTSSSGSPTIRVYCDMKKRCGPITGGWMRVASINMKKNASQCPPSLCLTTADQIRMCRLCSKLNTPTVEVFHTGVAYSKVCGRIIGYLSGVPTGFSVKYTETVDGIILSYDDPEVIIWSFAAESSNFVKKSTCPCKQSYDGTLMVPDVISQHYFCDTASTKVSLTATVNTQNPLWDGAGCDGDDNCCSFNNPPWFYRELSAPTSEDIRMTINLNDRKIIEDVAVEKIDIYVQ